MSLLEAANSISFALGMEKKLFPSPVVRWSNDFFSENILETPFWQAIFISSDLFCLIYIYWFRGH